MLTIATISQAQKTTVSITNDLGLPLRFYCKSADNNLGNHSLAPGGSWSFGFSPRVAGETLFFCNFSFGTESHYFDIYKQHRDRQYEIDGCTQCQWKIRKTGPCKKSRQTGLFTVCLPWKS
ncbi:unnamed protein product [Cochlearia groenlandica]